MDKSLIIDVIYCNKVKFRKTAFSLKVFFNNKKTAHLYKKKYLDY